MATKTKKPARAKKTIWVGVIPRIFGLGIATVSETRAGAMKALRESHAEWYKASKSPFDYVKKFEVALKHFGGVVREVELDRGYDEDFRN